MAACISTPAADAVRIFRALEDYAIASNGIDTADQYEGEPQPGHCTRATVGRNERGTNGLDIQA